MNLTSYILVVLILVFTLVLTHEGKLLLPSVSRRILRVPLTYKSSDDRKDILSLYCNATRLRRFVVSTIIIIDMV